jgi:hypothetical protein
MRPRPIRGAHALAGVGGEAQAGAFGEGEDLGEPLRGAALFTAADAESDYAAVRPESEQTSFHARRVADTADGRRTEFVA